MQTNSILSQAVNTPWKLYFELKRVLFHPFVLLYLKLNGVKVGKNTKWYGFPKVFKHKNSQIDIGDRVEVRNWKYSNPLGVNHPLILTTWSKNAKIKIGNDVGISGGVICASQNIYIGRGTLVGANSTLIDTDFHPLSGINRRYSLDDVKTKPIKIGKNVFIGTNSTILKGVNLSDDQIVPAGAVIR